MSEQTLPQKNEESVDNSIVHSGLKSLYQAVQNTYPNMTNTEIEKLVNIILNEIAKKILA